MITWNYYCAFDILRFISMPILNILRAILYELQPFTYADCVAFVAFLHSTIADFGSAFRDLQWTSAPRISISLPVLFRLFLWVLIWRVFVYAEFGSLWCMVTGIALIFLNLGQKSDPNELSAYSVFNKGQHRIPGTLTAEQFENEILHKTARFSDNDDWAE